MDAQNGLDEMFLLLQMNNVYATKQFKKDIASLVQTDVTKFITNFTRDMLRKNLRDYNRYEKLKLTHNQKKRLDGNNLYRYEYRNSSNLRCIYLIKDENTNKTTFLLSAFNEDWSKSNGKDTYNFNIERSIKIYEKIKEGGK